MDLLLDTHTLLWFFDDNKRLSNVNKKLISDIRNNCFVSIATIWELAIKLGLKKIDIGISFQEFINLLINNNFRLLFIKISHIQNLLNLPNFHKDPFDRILISQSKIENLTIISSDVIFDDYKINRIW